tara:strand:+ start:1311 stop:1892 length:582 start_codon:yes stop_codon:yes gene_type:complete
MLFSYIPDESVPLNIVRPVNIESIERSGRTKEENLMSRSALSSVASSEDIEFQLFENRSNLKQMISKIAMHMKDDVRKDFFKQLDNLLDIEEFTDDDSLINPRSFHSFLNFFAVTSGLKRIALTVAPSGNTVASWLLDNESLHIEFLSNSLATAVASLINEGEKETIVRQGSVLSMGRFLDDNNIHLHVKKDT